MYAHIIKTGLSLEFILMKDKKLFLFVFCVKIFMSRMHSQYTVCDVVIIKQFSKDLMSNALVFFPFSCK